MVLVLRALGNASLDASAGRIVSQPLQGETPHWPVESFPDEGMPQEVHSQMSAIQHIRIFAGPTCNLDVHLLDIFFSST